MSSCRCCASSRFNGLLNVNTHIFVFKLHPQSCILYYLQSWSYNKDYQHAMIEGWLLSLPSRELLICLSDVCSAYSLCCVDGLLHYVLHSSAYLSRTLPVTAWPLSLLLDLYGLFLTLWDVFKGFDEMICILDFIQYRDLYKTFVAYVETMSHTLIIIAIHTVFDLTIVSLPSETQSFASAMRSTCTYFPTLYLTAQ